MELPDTRLFFWYGWVVLQIPRIIMSIHPNIKYPRGIIALFISGKISILYKYIKIRTIKLGKKLSAEN